jgi:hypothetical protein
LAGTPGAAELCGAIENAEDALFEIRKNWGMGGDPNLDLRYLIMAQLGGMRLNLAALEAAYRGVGAQQGVPNDDVVPSDANQSMIELIETATANVQERLETRLAEARAEDDIAFAADLQDALHAMSIATVRYDGDFALFIRAKTESVFSRSTAFTVAITYDIDEMTLLYERGAPANRVLGYILDYPRGMLGIEYVITHEVRHGDFDNFYTPLGGPRVQRNAERDADEFVMRVYELGN